MRTPAKIALVAAGYVGAILVAFVTAAIYVASTSWLDRQASSGMYAFGDSLLFLAVFGVAAIPATGAMLFFLRTYRSFWLALSVAGLCNAGIGVAALIDYFGGQNTDSMSQWSIFAVLRILVAPLFALAFFLSCLFAPSRSFRIALFGATLVEVVVFTCIALKWLYSLLV